MPSPPSGHPVAIAVAGDEMALAWDGCDRVLPATAYDEVARLDATSVRWTWWSAGAVAPPLVEAGLRLGACWDLAAVSRLLRGVPRDDAAAVWAAHHGQPVEPAREPEPDHLFAAEPIARDAREWARLAARIQGEQLRELAALPDPRAAPASTPLAVLTAYAESAAALLAVELGHGGLPVDADVMAALLRPVIGERPVDDRHATVARRRRDDAVRRHFPHSDDVDLRNPAQVREMLGRVGFDLPDTRSWRLEPHAATSEAVRALLAWRKAERLSTTYGWAWLDRDLGADGRLRGVWGPAEGAGRMTASAGLHNMPADLRPAVRAEPGRVLVRADLGQVEPRVLAAVSGDPALAAAAREDDMYAPVAAALRSDRPTAKVAVLAAMYGSTTGAAGNALRDMDRAYPVAMAYLRDAEQAGRDGRDLRTYGGRLLPLRRGVEAGRYPPMSWGRFARNAVVQGAAAELFKAWAATVRLGLRPLGGEIVLCLHDELLVHVPAEHAGTTEHLLTDALTRTAGWWAAGSGVRFVADVTTGDSWADAH